MIWLCCLMTLAAPPAYIEVYTAEGPTGEVFLTEAEREQVRARIETDPAARATADALLESARNLAATPLDIPRQPGLWTHLYTCPVDGVRLEARSPAEHACPVCGEVYRGERYDGAWRSYRHKFWTAAVETLGWAHALEEDSAFAARAREILLQYAAFYEELPQLGRDGKPSRSGGRIHAQTLDEAMALVEVCVGYSLVREAPAFSDADRRTVRERLIRPMVRVIQPNNRGISNWQSWHNAAVGCAGFLLGDGGMADWAVNGEHGFVYQMEHAVKENGVWREESMSYHWLALRALVHLAEAAARADVDLYAVPQVKMLFDAPMRHLFPDLTFPPLHNADRSSITEFRALYEVANRRYGDARYAPLLDPRDTVWGLFWGTDSLPVDRPAHLVLESANDPADGLAVLRGPDDVALYLDYGGPGTAHTHPAKLGIVLFAHGNQRFVDPGRLRYSHPLHGRWYTQTVAHNAPVAGARSQKPSGGSLAAFAVTDEFRVVRTSADGAYPDVRFDRALAWCGGVILDVVQCYAGVEKSIDLPLHVQGALSGLPASGPAPALGAKDGYGLLEEVRQLEEHAFSALAEMGEGRGIRITVADPAGTAYQAAGIGSAPTERVPMLLRRQHGRFVLFVTAYQVYAGEPPPPPAVSVEQGNLVTVTVDDWSLELSGDTVLRINGTRHYVGENGVRGTRPAP